MCFKVLFIVFVGGEGKCFMFFMMDWVKLVVFFGGIYCFIDFVLFNLVNLGFIQIVVLIQYKFYLFDCYIFIIWWMLIMLGFYVILVLVQQCFGLWWYQGSVDVIYQFFNFINDQSFDYVVVFGVDNIYWMDVDVMLQYYIDFGLGCIVVGI